MTGDEGPFGWGCGSERGALDCASIPAPCVEAEAEAEPALGSPVEVAGAAVDLASTADPADPPAAAAADRPRRLRPAEASMPLALSVAGGE